MKKLLAVLLAALLIFAMVGCGAQKDKDDSTDKKNNAEATENVYEDFKYDVNENGELEITGFTYTGDQPIDVKIPDIIDDRPIVGIGNDAFKAHKNIKSVTFHDSITYIGDYAFADCDYLTKVTLPKNLETVGVGSFMNCDVLEAIFFPASLKAIGVGAFKNCVALQNFTLPANILAIDDSAFWGCTALTSVAIPATVIDLGDGAFYGCTNLAEVSLLGNPSKADDAILAKMNGAIAAVEGDAPKTLAEANQALLNAGLTLVSLSDKGSKFVWDKSENKLYGTFTKADEALLASMNAILAKNECASIDLVTTVLKAEGITLTNLNATIDSDKFVWDADNGVFTTVYFGDSVFEGCTINTILSVTSGTFFAAMAEANGYITVYPATAPVGQKIFSNGDLSFCYPKNWTKTILPNTEIRLESSNTYLNIAKQPRNLLDDHTAWADENFDAYIETTNITPLPEGQSFVDPTITQITNENGVNITKVAFSITDGTNTSAIIIYKVTIGNTTYTITLSQQAATNPTIYTMIENSFADAR